MHIDLLANPKVLCSVSSTVFLGYGRQTRTLNVDSPFLRVEVEGLQRSLLAESFGLVDEFVASVISSTRISFRVLVCHIDGKRGPRFAFLDTILCITLPSASRTAWDVKFSEGIRFMKCFCLFFSYMSLSG